MMMMMSLEQTPMPLLPSFGACTPMPPKRKCRTSSTLNRRVRANLNELCIPDIQSGTSAPLKLTPQGRTSFAGLSFDKILINGAKKHMAQTSSSTPTVTIKKSHVIPPLPKSHSPGRKVISPSVLKSSSPRSNNSLMALRMAAMVKGSADPKAQLMFGGKFNKTFELPGRARSSPYRPLVSRTPPMRSRSFGAVCA
jgi:hypothetical protein